MVERDVPVGVRIEPVRLEWIEALSVGDHEFSRRFGIEVEPGWVGFPDALPNVLAAARTRDRDLWGSYLFFAPDGALVGWGGFKGAPEDGQVEIGYSIAPTRQGQGLATAAALATIDVARRHAVETVIAHTLAETNASTGVLERCGFEHMLTLPDPDGGVDGDVWRWELRG